MAKKMLQLYLDEFLAADCIVYLYIDREDKWIMGVDERNNHHSLISLKSFVAYYSAIEYAEKAVKKLFDEWKSFHDYKSDNKVYVNSRFIRRIYEDEQFEYLVLEFTVNGLESLHIDFMSNYEHGEHDPYPVAFNTVYRNFDIVEFE